MPWLARSRGAAHPQAGKDAGTSNVERPTLNFECREIGAEPSGVFACNRLPSSRHSARTRTADGRAAARYRMAQPVLFSNIQRWTLEVGRSPYGLLR
jgi:hypothetical protein